MAGLFRYEGHRHGRRSSRTLLQAAALVLVTTVLAVGCVEEADPLNPNRLGALEVELVDTGNLGPAPHAFLSQYTSITISVEALTPDGRRKDDYNGTLQIRVVPGKVSDDSRFVTLTDGFNAAHPVRLRYAFGPTRIWVEEVGLGTTDECRDGFDNDGDGRVDYPADPGCTSPEDPSEGAASYTTGLSDVLEFETISIRAIQYNADDPRGISPLLDEAVVIEQGSLIVTNVVINGFYITDVEESRGYDSIFVFNYSFPDGVQVGDKMSWVAGGVDEFQQDTQLTFPTWEHDDSYELLDSDRGAMARCEPVDNPNVVEVEPTLLTATTIRDLAAMEAVESALVRIENAQVSNRFLHCDWDINGEIDGPDEENCRTQCQNDPLCTELSNFWNRDQFNVVVGGAQAQVSQAGVVARFDPTEGCEVVSSTNPYELACPDRTLAQVTGTLRHVYLTSRIQLWEIIPRYSCDVQFACATNDDCPNDLQCSGDVCRDPAL